MDRRIRAERDTKNTAVAVCSTKDTARLTKYTLGPNSRDIKNMGRDLALEAMGTRANIG